MKNDNKFTPGPWAAVPNVNSEIDLCSIKGPKGDGLALTTNRDGNLIAVAPELLEALEKFSNDIEALKHSIDEADFPLELAEYSTAYLEPYLKQLIAKAKGES